MTKEIAYEIANTFNSQVKSYCAKVSTCLGTLFYYVEWYRDNEPIAISFESMSSVLDFLKSNF